MGVLQLLHRTRVNAQINMDAWTFVTDATKMAMVWVLLMTRANSNLEK